MNAVVNDRSWVSALEAVYRPAASTTEWLQGVVDAIDPAFQRGFGAAAYTLNFEGGGAVLGNAVRTSGCPDVATIAPRMNEAMPPELVRRLYLGPRTVNSAAQLMTVEAFEQTESVRQHFLPKGIRDVIGVHARDGSPRIVTLCFPSAKVRDFSPDDERQLAQLASHVSAGLRLVRTTAVAPAAVLGPDGTVLHAMGTAKTDASRKQLRAHAVAIERARRGRDGTSIDLWRVLAEATWSLVEVFERDGRRHYIARENAGATAGPRALGPRERHVLALLAAGHSNKMIAYALGLSSSSVSAQVRSAMAKLGVTRRADLMRLLADASRDG